MNSDPPNPPADSFSPLTSNQPAALAVIHVAGPAFERFADLHLRIASDPALARLSTGDARRASLCDTDGEAVDDIVVSVRSAGPEWDVWLHLHGGPWIAQRCAELLAAAGFAEARPRGTSIFPAASPLDAAIAERLPAMLTLAGVRWLTGQAELLPKLVRHLADAADRHPHLVRRACASLATSLRIFDWYSRPLRIALMGPPNAGKSTLFNRLAGEPASITSAQPGTTRDWVEAPGELAGFPVIWIDTAGIFEATDPLDAAGVAATAAAALSADLRVAVLDGTDAEFAHVPWLKRADAIALNKSDVSKTINAVKLSAENDEIASVLSLSALTGHGISAFQDHLLRFSGRSPRIATRPAVFTDAQARNAADAALCGDHKYLKNLILQLTE